MKLLNLESIKPAKKLIQRKRDGVQLKRRVEDRLDASLDGQLLLLCSLSQSDKRAEQQSVPVSRRRRDLGADLCVVDFRAKRVVQEMRDGNKLIKSA